MTTLAQANAIEDARRDDLPLQDRDAGKILLEHMRATFDPHGVYSLTMHYSDIVAPLAVRLRSKPFIVDRSLADPLFALDLIPQDSTHGVIKPKMHSHGHKELAHTWFFRICHQAPANAHRINKTSDSLSSRDVTIQIYTVRRYPV